MLQNLWDISPILSLLLFTVGGLVTYIKIKDKQNLNITQQMVDVLKSETISAKQESRELKEAFNTVTKTFQDTMQSLKNENDENKKLFKESINIFNETTKTFQETTATIKRLDGEVSDIRKDVLEIKIRQENNKSLSR